MAVVQEAFFIPDNIMTKLLTGEYRRIGGVVRVAVGDGKGQIVKHLKPVDLQKAEEVQSSGMKIMQFAKNHKNILIACGITGAAAIVGIIYHKMKSAEPVVLKQFRSALYIYQ